MFTLLMRVLATAQYWAWRDYWHVIYLLSESRPQEGIGNYWFSDLGEWVKINHANF